MRGWSKKRRKGRGTNSNVLLSVWKISINHRLPVLCRMIVSTAVL